MVKQRYVYLFCWSYNFSFFSFAFYQVKLNPRIKSALYNVVNVQKIMFKVVVLSTRSFVTE